MVYKFILTVCVVLSGCSSVVSRDNYTLFDAGEINHKTVLTYHAVDNPGKACTGSEDVNYLGCAKWSKKKCIIWVGKDTSMAVIGHEIRHCFEGHFH